MVCYTRSPPNGCTRKRAVWADAARHSSGNGLSRRHRRAADWRRFKSFLSVRGPQGRMILPPEGWESRSLPGFFLATTVL